MASNTRKTFPNQRAPFHKSAASNAKANEATIVKVGEMRFIISYTSNPRVVCALNGWMIQIGAITMINPIIRTTNNPNQISLRLPFERLADFLIRGIAL